ncbi:unnamed protein product [Amoebophrya sp. A120]|nr:unnamed protein product [Amoebophrya sp. A120]|eukprot:GSA120T00024927001.1
MITVRVVGTSRSKRQPPSIAEMSARSMWKDRKCLEVGQYVCTPTCKNSDFIVRDITVSASTGEEIDSLLSEAEALGLVGGEGPVVQNIAGNSTSTTTTHSAGATTSTSSKKSGGVTITTLPVSKLPYTEKFVKDYQLDVKVDARETFTVFRKLHILPYEDTFAYNYDHMYHNQILPFFRKVPIPFVGLDHEFSHNGGRFRVVGIEYEKPGAATSSDDQLAAGDLVTCTSPLASSSTLETDATKEKKLADQQCVYCNVLPLPKSNPAGVLGCAGNGTAMFYEGPKLPRVTLDLIHVLPYERGFPERLFKSEDNADSSPTKENKYVKMAREKKAKQAALLAAGNKASRTASATAAGSSVGKEVDGKLILKEFLQQYFDNRSSAFKIGEAFNPAERCFVLSGKGLYAHPAQQPPNIWFKVISTTGGAFGVGSVGAKTEIKVHGTCVREEVPKPNVKEMARAMEQAGSGNKDGRNNKSRKDNGEEKGDCSLM